VEVEGNEEKNLVEVNKGNDNDWTSMPSSSPIASYFILHTLPLFRPSKHQLVRQPTP